MDLYLDIIIGLLIGVIVILVSEKIVFARSLDSTLLKYHARISVKQEFACLFKDLIHDQSLLRKRILVLLVFLFLTCFFHFFPMPGISIWKQIPLLIYLGIVLVIDIQYQAVPLEVTSIGVILCFALGSVQNGLIRTISGGFAGFILMLILYSLGVLFAHIYKRIFRLKTDILALGFADVFAGGFLGFFAGWPDIVLVLLIALLGSGLYSIFNIVTRVVIGRYRTLSTFPYTPFLIFGALLTIYARK